MPQGTGANQTQRANPCCTAALVVALPSWRLLCPIIDQAFSSSFAMPAHQRCIMADRSFPILMLAEQNTSAALSETELPLPWPLIGRRQWSGVGDKTASSAQDVHPCISNCFLGFCHVACPKCKLQEHRVIASHSSCTRWQQLICLQI